MSGQEPFGSLPVEDALTALPCPGCTIPHLGPQGSLCPACRLISGRKRARREVLDGIEKALSATAVLEESVGYRDRVLWEVLRGQLAGATEIAKKIFEPGAGS